MVAIPIFNCKCTDLFILAFSLTAFKTITDSIDHATKQSSPYPAYSSGTPTDDPVRHQTDSAI